MRYKNGQSWILWYSICSWEDYIIFLSEPHQTFLIIIPLSQIVALLIQMLGLQFCSHCHFMQSRKHSTSMANFQRKLHFLKVKKNFFSWYPSKSQVHFLHIALGLSFIDNPGFLFQGHYILWRVSTYVSFSIIRRRENFRWLLFYGTKCFNE